MLMIIVGLAVLGLCAGSFINALVYRLRWQETHTRSSKKHSILKGRSICPHCKYRLSAKDLVPVLSWLFLKAKCRYCGKPISIQYPLVETITAMMFVISYIFWPYSISGTSDKVIFGLWLAILAGLIALAIYDIKWMLLPNKIIFPLFALVLLSIIIQTQATSYDISGISVLYGVVVGGGIFYILFQISAGRWIGGGDVKLGFLLGALAAEPLAAFLILFIASLLGSLFSIPLLLKNRFGAKSKIAFGPFLIAAGIIVVLFGESIIEVYNNLLML